MEENIDWLFDDPLPSVDLSVCDHHLKTEVKCEAGCENQMYDGTGVKAESPVKEEVQVKVEREEEASVKQCLHLSAPDDCGACVLKCGRAEGNSEGGCAGMEGEKYKRSVQSKCCLLPYVLLRRMPDTGLGGVGSLGLAQGEQCMEEGSMCQQEQALTRPASCGSCVWCPVVKVEGGGVYGSACGREEEERRHMGREGVVQPPVSMEDYKVEVKPETCEEIGVERLVEGEEQEEERGVHLQAGAESSVATGARWSESAAQWSEDSSGPEASSSSEVSEPRPCVSSLETAQSTPLEIKHCSPPRQKQSRKKGRVQSPGSVVHQEAREASSPHANVNTVHEGVRKYACPHCEYICRWRNTLRIHVETVHERSRRYACPHCLYKAGQNFNLQRHITRVHESSKTYPCPSCPYRAGQKDTLQQHIDYVHEGLWKYPCPHCQYIAGNKGDLQKHIANVHEGARKHPCPHCPYRAGWKGDLRKHIDAVHEGLKNYPCPYCQYRTSRKCNLQRHLHTVHES